MSSFNFRGLPRELRDEIYKQTMTMEHKAHFRFWMISTDSTYFGDPEVMHISINPVKDSGLAMCCRQIKTEYEEQLQRQQQHGYHLHCRGRFPVSHNFITRFDYGSTIGSKLSSEVISQIKTLQVDLDIEIDEPTEAEWLSLPTEQSTYSFIFVDVVTKARQGFEKWFQFVLFPPSRMSLLDEDTSYEMPSLEHFTTTLHLPSWCSAILDKAPMNIPFDTAEMIKDLNFRRNGTQLPNHITVKIAAGGIAFEIRFSKDKDMQYVVDE